MSKTHTCCDGECNHDDCCGKIPDNCPNNMTNNNEEIESLYEKLASIEHQRWADWQRYMHSKSARDKHTGDMIVPCGLVERWERQIATKYNELSEQEKQSDREEVDRYWKLVEDFGADQYKKGVEEERERILKLIPDRNPLIHDVSWAEGYNACRLKIIKRLTP